MKLKISDAEFRTFEFKIRLWFEYYKVALSDENDVYKQVTKATKKLFKAWGDVRSVEFDDWWPTHQHLFDQAREPHVAKAVSLDPSVLTVAIPIYKPDWLNGVRALVAEAKKCERGPSAVSLYPRIKLNTRRAYVALLIYSKIVRPLEERGQWIPRNEAKVLSRVRAYADKFDWKDRMGASLNDSDRYQSLRRHVDDAKQWALSAAQGYFPWRDTGLDRTFAGEQKYRRMAATGKDPFDE